MFDSTLAVAASAYENLTWINRLIDYVKYLAEEKPKIRLIGQSICLHFRSADAR